MTQFNEENQQKPTQSPNVENNTSNPSGQTLSIENIENTTDLSALLIQLQAAVTQATTNGTIPKKIGIDTRAALEKAVVEIEEPVPDKKSLLDHLAEAQTLIDSIAGTNGLISSIVAAIETIRKIL